MTAVPSTVVPRVGLAVGCGIVAVAAAVSAVILTRGTVLAGLASWAGTGDEATVTPWLTLTIIVVLVAIGAGAAALALGVRAIRLGVRPAGTAATVLGAIGAVGGVVWAVVLLGSAVSS